jgi:hypothetical protein
VNQIQTECFPKIQIDSSSPGFDELIIEALDQTLTNLGAKVKQEFYHFLAYNYKLDEKEIPHKIRDFVEALETIFGPGASLIQIDVLKRLQLKVPSFIYLLESSDLGFEAYLASLKEFVENLN